MDFYGGDDYRVQAHIRESIVPDGYVSDVINWHEFVVTFTYAALGNNYKGRYKSTLPKAVGEAFPLQFNPAKPQMNSMSAPVQSLWAKVIMWLIALSVCISSNTLLPRCIR